MDPIMRPEIKYTKLFIDNMWMNACSGRTFDTMNPATGELLARVAEGDTADVEKAVQAAEDCSHRLSTWRALDASGRAELLYRLADLIQRDCNYLASLESYNCGKPYLDAYKDIIASSMTLRYYAGAADKVCGQTIPADGNSFVYTLHEPVGVCAAITPWNYPFLMCVIKFAPCLAMGNSLILKPAEQTPLTALAFAALAMEAGFPPGVFNVIPGYGPTAGAALVNHPKVRKITFTGSTSIGKLIQQQAAMTMKRVSLELGGKSPLIIMPDCDLEKAVNTAHNMVFINQGQCCIAASRCYVHEDIYDDFCRMSVELAKTRTVGNPLKLSSMQGPQINEIQFNKIMNLIESGRKEGARLAYGGERVGDKGYFIQPTVFVDVRDEMRIAKEEIFGPVQSIFRFTELEDVIDRANESKYGLGAGIFTKDLNTALYAASRLQAGQVYVNNYFNASIQVPFGGYKESGIGREFGIDGLRQYYEVKSVIIDTRFKTI